jgi:hypothetical protein
MICRWPDRPIERDFINERSVEEIHSRVIFKGAEKQETRQEIRDGENVTTVLPPNFSTGNTFLEAYER